MSYRTNLPNTTIPDVQLGFLVKGEVQSVSASEIFAYGRTVVPGVPGAFTPVCTNSHIPDFLAQADAFDMQGSQPLVCIAPNDPFVLEARAKAVDVECRIRFLSDGNFEFTRALALNSANPDLFLGEWPERYLMVVENGVIVRLRVEQDILTHACSGASDALAAANSLDITMM